MVTAKSFNGGEAKVVVELKSNPTLVDTDWDKLNVFDDPTPLNAHSNQFEILNNNLREIVSTTYVEQTGSEGVYYTLRELFAYLPNSNIEYDSKTGKATLTSENGHTITLEYDTSDITPGENNVFFTGVLSVTGGVKRSFITSIPLYYKNKTVHIEESVIKYFQKYGSDEKIIVGAYTLTHEQVSDLADGMRNTQINSWIIYDIIVSGIGSGKGIIISVATTLSRSAVFEETVIAADVTGKRLRVLITDSKHTHHIPQR